MRPVLLNAYAEMLPRLQAEEDLRTISTLAVGTGAADKRDIRAHVRDLMRATGEHARPATTGDVTAMGITVEEVPVG